MSAPPTKLRVGIIGTGAFAQVCHIPGLQSHPQTDVIAIAARREEAGRAVADRFGVRDVHTDFRELCARDDIDAVTIASANMAHAEQAQTAFQFGKHVFCEKPLGLNVAEAKAMLDAAISSGKVHQVGFTFRYNYGIAELRRRLQAGDIGRPFYFRIQYDRWDGLKPDLKASWREKQELAGGGLLFDLGSHLFDIVRYVLGDIEELIGFTYTVPREAIDTGTGNTIAVETDDMANVWLQNTDSLRGQFFISRITPPFAQLGYLEVIGPEGALKAALSRGSVDFLRISKPTSPEWVDLPLPAEAGDKQPHALGIMMRSFADACIRGKSEPNRDATFRDGLVVQQAMDAVAVSMKEKRWTKIQQ